MTTATMAVINGTVTESRPRRSLEELVDRLFATLTFGDESAPVPSTVAKSTRKSPAIPKPRRSLEELVDRLMATLTFPHETDPATVAPSAVVPTIHEARRLRQSGDLEGALQTLACADLTASEAQQTRWVFTEWKHLIKRRFGQLNPLLYSQAMGRAAALVPHNGGRTLEVVAVLGMSWKPGKLVSRRSLRGLRPLAMGGA